METGGTIEGFWKATPRLLYIQVQGYRRRRGWLAWHVAALGRTEKLPDLADVMGLPPALPMTTDQIFDALDRLLG